MTGLDVVGTSIPRVEAQRKVTGALRYPSDISLSGMLHAKALRSNVAHGRVVHVDAAAARELPGVHAVLTRDDLADTQPFGWFIKDQTMVATDKVRYVGDVVAAVAAETPSIAVAALELIDVQIEPFPEVTDILTADLDAPPLFDEPPPGIVPPYGIGASAQLNPRTNVCYEFNYTTGVDGVWDTCDHVFEDAFTCSRMNHFHLEPFVSVARVDGDLIELWTSTQNPFPLRKELARVFGHPENRIRIHALPIGGGFGSKHNCRTEPVAIRLAQMTGRPVRWALTTEEGFLTNSQHAAHITLRTGVRDGMLVARQAFVRLNSGAYSDGSPLVAEKAAYRAAGPYRWEYVDSTCACVMTNTTPAGALRGFGGTQVIWAGESQVDLIARRLGEDPVEFRKRNLLRLGDPFTTNESQMDSDLVEGLNVVVDALDDVPDDGLMRGVGAAIGVKDGGGVNKPAQARVKVTTTGHAYLHCGTVEIGQGVMTAMSQVVAEILCLPVNKVLYAPINTDSTPFDQGTNASSSMTVMGKAVEQAARGVREQILDFAGEFLGVPAGDLGLDDWHIVNGAERVPLMPMVMRTFGGTGFEFSADGYFKAPNDHKAPLEAPCVFWEVGWAAAAVTVDPETGSVTVDQLVVSGDAGRAINPMACRGQDEGAAVMGFAQAMFEHLDFDGSQLRNIDVLDYRVPLAEDLPERFESILQEQGHGPGPFGAKGMGEGAMLPVAPAIANAIHDATGKRVYGLPLDPPRVLAALLEDPG